MTEIFRPPFFQPDSINGVPLAGSKLYFYQAGTSTVITVYQDYQATTPHASPVVADSSGIFPTIYVTSSLYKFSLFSALNILVKTIDYISGSETDSVAIVVDDPTAASANVIAIQAAIDAGTPIQLPAGTTYVNLTQAITLEGGLTACSLVAKTGMQLRGVGIGRSVLKMKDNSSTDASPVYFNMIAGNTVISDLHIEGITFDLNGANNSISPDRSRFYTCNVFNGTPGQIQTTVVHGLSANDPVRLWNNAQGDTIGSPVVRGTTYYVKTVLSTTVISISATPGGAAITIASGGTTICTLERIGTYNAYNTAALMISGRVSTVGVDARIEHGKILDCEVINVPGVTAIALGQQEGTGTHSLDVEIAGCRFYNCGIDSSDHSSVYAWGDEVNVHDCTFEFPTVSIGRGSPVAAIESHGNDNAFHDNVMINYLVGVLACGDANGAISRINIANNHIKVAQIGVLFWTISPLSAGSLRSVQVIDNLIEIPNSGPTKNVFYLGTPRQGVSCFATNADIVAPNISNNIIRTQDQTTNLGIYVAADTGKSVKSANVVGNLLDGFSIGITAALGGSGTVDDILIANNKITNTNTTESIAVNTRGIVFSGTLSGAIIGNKASGGTVSPAIGILTAGTAASFVIKANDVTQATLGISDAIVATIRSGDQEASFTPTITASVGAITTATATGAYQRKDGWVRYWIKYVIVDVGTAAGFATISTPLTALGATTHNASGVRLAGDLMSILPSSTTALVATLATGLTPFANGTWYINGEMQIA